MRALHAHDQAKWKGGTCWIVVGKGILCSDCRQKREADAITSIDVPLCFKRIILKLFVKLSWSNISYSSNNDSQHWEIRNGC